MLTNKLANRLSIAEKLSIGRLLSQRVAPYFRAMIHALVPYPCEWVPTIGVTKTGMMPYNPQFIDRMSSEEMCALYWHEVMHLVLGHADRRGNRDPYLWNVAGDIFINDQGRSTLNLTFPKGGWFPEAIGAPRNLTTDEYYALLVKMGKDAVEGQSPGEEGDWESGSCGSGAGNALDKEPEEQGKIGGRSESDLQQRRIAVADAIRNHMQSGGNARGTVPLGLDRWAGDMLAPPRVPWQSVLARTVRRAVAYRPGAVDYSFSRVSRRQGGVGFGVGAPILPALVRPVPQVAVVLDTSGSMSGEQLRLGLGETSGVLKACGSEIEFLSCDHAVHAHGTVATPAQLASMVKGGGGSSFVPAFEHLARMRNRPQLAIFMTDGMIEVPHAPPRGMDVIWLLVGVGAEFAPTRNYGTTIVID